MALPGVGSYFRRMGVLPAHADSITAALAAGQDVALWPGGERDSLRPWTQRDEAVLAGRTGFIRLAIRSQVPIVPIATVGGPDSMPVIASGRRLAEALQLDRIARLKMFPIALQFPWGISPAMLPEIPLPTKIRTAFQDPVELDPTRARARTRTTSTPSTRGASSASSRGWTRWPGAGAYRCLADPRRRRGTTNHRATIRAPTMAANTIAAPMPATRS